MQPTTAAATDTAVQIVSRFLIDARDSAVNGGCNPRYLILSQPGEKFQRLSRAQVAGLDKFDHTALRKRRIPSHFLELECLTNGRRGRRECVLARILNPTLKPTIPTQLFKIIGIDCDSIDTNLAFIFH